MRAGISRRIRTPINIITPTNMKERSLPITNSSLMSVFKMADPHQKKLLIELSTSRSARLLGPCGTMIQEMETCHSSLGNRGKREC
jgi:hypothetical protein